MYSIILAIIYLAFISMGLPDSLLGAAWPVMQGGLGVPLSYAGIITMTISGGTIVSSLLSDRLIRRFGAGKVTAVSTAMTAVALFGFSASTRFWMLWLCAVPYGLGAGSIDAALNNYVALHYSSRHMSWLHACWGVGVTISPYIMSAALTAQKGWQSGYHTVGWIQICLTAVLFATLPLWKKVKWPAEQEEIKPKLLSIREALKIPGVPYVMIEFFAFCAVENCAGLWASTYLVEHRGVGVETAARFASLFYTGVMVGRFLNGFIADRFGDKKMIRTGIYVMLAGIAMVALPVQTDLPALAGLVVIGLGSAPIYPCIIHSTPTDFGRENSQSLVGMQMASAYVGSTFTPPIFGLIAQHISVALYPAYLLFFTLLVLLMTHLLAKALAKTKERQV